MDAQQLPKKDKFLLGLLGSWVLSISLAYTFYFQSPYRDTKFALNGLFTLLLLVPLLFRRPFAGCCF